MWPKTLNKDLTQNVTRVWFFKLYKKYIKRAPIEVSPLLAKPKQQQRLERNQWPPAQ